MSWEIEWLTCDMTLKTFSYKRDLILSIPISGDLNIFYTGFNSLYCPYIFYMTHYGFIFKLIFLCLLWLWWAMRPKGILFLLRSVVYDVVFVMLFWRKCQFFWQGNTLKERNLCKKTIDNIYDGWYLRSKLMIKSSS